MAIINTDHKIAYPEPLRLQVGDTFEILPKEGSEKWLGWHWAKTPTQTGWISENYFERRDGRTLVIRNYDATELAVTRGDSVTLLFEDNGWAYVKNRQGSSGWIPSEVIADLEPHDLTAFILEGKLKGWVGSLNGGRKIAATRVGSRDVVFDRGRFHYHDSFVGMSDFIGQEHVAFNGVPAWSMSYFGYLLKPELFCAQDAVKVLQSALPKVYLVEKRFLGGFVHHVGDTEYRDVNHGDWQRFHGVEKICLRG
ncbi:MAG: DUF5680 domain-containing protein, partial [Bdellovibrionota bacterium]